MDIRHPEEVKIVFNQVHPDVVYLPAAFTNVDECEKTPDLARAINVTGVENVALQVKKSMCKLVFFSTDYIFNGRHGPYDEQSSPNPICEYGKQKLEAEEIIQDLCVDPLIIRTTIVFGWEPQRKNFVTRMIENLRKGHRVKVPYDQFGNPTYAPDLVSAVMKLVEMGCAGIFNVVGCDRVSRYQFAQDVAKVFSLQADLINPVATRDLEQIAQRPLQVGLITDKVARTLKRTMPGYGSGLMKMKEVQFDF